MVAPGHQQRQLVHSRPKQTALLRCERSVERYSNRNVVQIVVVSDRGFPERVLRDALPSIQDCELRDSAEFLHFSFSATDGIFI
jgi:hypothetical protein